jgi:ABC-type multidrug transport system ATPase subunit
MISIKLNQIGKKFGREWIFKGLSLEILPYDKLVILGGNGSGKSTLLQLISGFLSFNEGEIVFISTKGVKIADDKVKDLIALASPYLQLIEDYTIVEMIEHVSSFKPFMNQLTTNQLIEMMDFSFAKDKYIKQFSSGMKQRLRLGLAILADTPILLLDEPVSNLDKKAIAWYKKMIENYTKDKTVIVCSNAIENEYFFCNKQIDVTNFKA